MQQLDIFSLEPQPVEAVAKPLPATDQADNRQRLAAIAHHEGKLKMHTDKLAELVGLNASEGMTASRNAAIRVAQQERQKILADLKALGVG